MGGEQIRERLLELAASRDNHCFVCGSGNPKGLHLHFEEDGGVIRAQFSPDEWHEGWQGVIHGGLLATVMDEAMAYTLYFSGILGFTARMELRYRNRVHRGDDLAVTAAVAKETARLADVDAVIRRGSEIVAEARGRFMKAGPLTEEMLSAGSLALLTGNGDPKTTSP